MTKKDITIVKNALLDYMLCVCCLRFRFLSKSMLFMLNTNLHLLMFLFSPSNGLLYNPIFSYGFVPLNAVPSVFQGWGAKLV